MVHILYRVTSFRLLKGYIIQVWFDDGTQQQIDFGPVLYGELWGPLRNPQLFQQVAIDPIAHTLTWPNGADFDPETLRNWADYKDELAVRSQSWDRVAA